MRVVIGPLVACCSYGRAVTLSEDDLLSVRRHAVDSLWPAEGWVVSGLVEVTRNRDVDGYALQQHVMIEVLTNPDAGFMVRASGRYTDGEHRSVGSASGHHRDLQAALADVHWHELDRIEPV